MKISDTKFLKHVEYTFIDNVCYRVCRPFDPDQALLVPIISPEDELEKDKALWRQRPIIIPSYNETTEDPNELRDYYLDKPFGEITEHIVPE